MTAFNEHVRDNIMSLSLCGEMSDDLMTNLFDGYLACADKKFIEYIACMKDAYDEGAELTSETLMTRAETKYAQCTDSTRTGTPQLRSRKTLLPSKPSLKPPSPTSS